MMKFYLLLLLTLFSAPAHAQGIDSDGNAIEQVNVTPENDEATRNATISNDNDATLPNENNWFRAREGEEDVNVQEEAGGLTIRTRDGHYLGPDGLTIHAGDGRYIMPDGSLFIDQGEDLDLPFPHLP